MDATFLTGIIPEATMEGILEAAAKLDELKRKHDEQAEQVREGLIMNFSLDVTQQSGEFDLLNPVVFPEIKLTFPFCGVFPVL